VDNFLVPSDGESRMPAILLYPSGVSEKASVVLGRGVYTPAETCTPPYDAHREFYDESGHRVFFGRFPPPPTLPVSITKEVHMPNDYFIQMLLDLRCTSWLFQHIVVTPLLQEGGSPPDGTIARSTQEYLGTLSEHDEGVVPESCVRALSRYLQGTNFVSNARLRRFRAEWIQGALLRATCNFVSCMCITCALHHSVSSETVLNNMHYWRNAFLTRLKESLRGFTDTVTDTDTDTDADDGVVEDSYAAVDAGGVTRLQLGEHSQPHPLLPTYRDDGKSPSLHEAYLPVTARVCRNLIQEQTSATREQRPPSDGEILALATQLLREESESPSPAVSDVCTKVYPHLPPESASAVLLGPSASLFDDNPRVVAFELIRYARSLRRSGGVL
jgi:hypothetical protein